MGDYQAGIEGGEYFYPGAGDPAPRKGAKVSLLTIGGVHATGPWDPDNNIGWLPLPKRNRAKEEIIAKLPRRYRK